MRALWLIALGALVGCSEAPAPAPVAAAPVAAPAPTVPACDVSMITVKVIKGGFENHCKTRQCIDLKGAVTIVNGCPMPVGVQVKVIGRDASGNAVATRDIWPASTSNIQPGEYVFPLDYALDYQPGMTSLEIQPIAVRQW